MEPGGAGSMPYPTALAGRLWLLRAPYLYRRGPNKSTIAYSFFVLGGVFIS
jgi:hypothetical protein